MAWRAGKKQKRSVVIKMETDKQLSDDFTQGNILQKLIKFMIPILGALILQAMYGAVDLLVVGKFGTDTGISAVIWERRTSRGSVVLLAVICFFAVFTVEYVRICGGGIVLWSMSLAIWCLWQGLG